MDLKVCKRICKLTIEYTFGRTLNEKKESFSIDYNCFLINKCSKTLQYIGFV